MQILGEVEAAPSVPIFTGQIGTTIIPSALSTATISNAAMDVETSLESGKGSDIRMDEVGHRPVVGTEYYDVR